MKKKKKDSSKIKNRNAFLISLTVLWVVFSVVFFTLPDFPADPIVTGRTQIQEIFYRLSIALGFGFTFGCLFVFVFAKRRTIEWGFVIIWISAYVGCTVLIVWLFGGRDFSKIGFLDLVYSLLLGFPATIIVVETLEAVL